MTIENPDFSQLSQIDIDTGREAESQALDTIVDRVDKLLDGVGGAISRFQTPEGSQETAWIRRGAFSVNTGYSVALVETLTSDTSRVDINLKRRMHKTPRFIVVQSEMISIEKTTMGTQGTFRKEARLRQFDQENGLFVGVSEKGIAALRTRAEHDRDHEVTEALAAYDAVGSMWAEEPVTQARADATMLDLQPLTIASRAITIGENRNLDDLF